MSVPLNPAVADDAEAEDPEGAAAIPEPPPAFEALDALPGELAGGEPETIVVVVVVTTL